MKKPSEFAKAVTSSVVVGLGAAEVATIDNHFTLHEAVVVALAVAGSFAATYAVPNARRSK